MSALREILAKFTIDVDDEELEKAGEKVEGFIGTLKAALPVFAEAFAIDALREFVDSQIEAATALERTSNTLGLSTEQLEIFQYAAGDAGVSADDMNTSLRFLNRNIAEAITKGGDVATTFAAAGIALKNADGTTRDASDVMADLADHVAEMPDAAKKTKLAMDLLGRGGSALIPVLNRGGEAFQEAKKDLDELGGTTSQEFIENAKRIEETQHRLAVAFGNVKQAIVTYLLPAFEWITAKGVKLAQAFFDFNKNTDIVRHGMELLATVAGAKLVLTLGKLGKAFGLLKPSIWQTLVALFEFAIPIALVGLFALLIEDLWTAIEGGDSVIGDMLVNLAGVEGKDAFVKDLIEAWTELKEVWDSLSGADPLSVVAGTIKFLVRVFYELVETGKLFFDVLVSMADIVTSLVQGFGKLGKAWDDFMDDDDSKSTTGQWLSKIGGDISDAFSGAGQANRDGGNKVISDLGAIVDPSAHWRQHPAVQTIPGQSTPAGDETPAGPNASYAPPRVGPAGGRTMNQKNEINVTVQGSKDAKATGRAVGAGVASELEDQNRNSDEALESM